MDYKWSDEEREVVKRLGRPECEQRIADLPDYRRYDTLANWNIGYEMSVTPAQVKAYAAFADTLGKDAEITQGFNIRRAKSHDELLHLVAVAAVDAGE